MLQPRQLEEVSVRYANEIAELADFFAKAGLTLQTPETFSAVAARVRGDRAFSRDLTSHVWVFIHATGRQVSYSDLLGMMAIAAAGPRFAASANEADAHDLLRFLMEARGAFDAPLASHKEVLVSVPTPLPAFVPAATPEPLAIRPTVAYIRQAEPEEAPPLSFEMPQNGEENRPVVWFAFAACALLLLFGSLWFLHSSSTGHSAPIAATTELAPLTAPPAVDATRTAPPPTERSQNRTRRQGQVTRRAPAFAPTRTQPEARLSSQPTPALAPSNVATYTPPTAPLNRMNKPSPASPSMAKASPTKEPTPMRLLRRPGTVPPVVPVSSLDVLDSRTNNTSTGGSLRQATVRATSLGTMAGNVTYSPAPAYPKAASAQHVQGEVKLEAEVDPTGSVVSTRIISGPPLLQEAAADAVQRWRYRPYLYNDKPIGMNTTVVMDFQLP